MNVFQKYTITGEENQLQHLLADLKENLKKPFSIDKGLTKEYAECMFVDTNVMACFKTKFTRLFESSVYICINKHTLSVMDIISPAMSKLGIDRYNMVLVEFVKSLHETISFQNYNVTELLTSAEYKMAEHMSDEAYEALSSWIELCPKNAPFSHELDEKLWFEFLYKLNESKEQPSESTFERWLREDKEWPLGFEEELDEVIDKYSYSLRLFEYGNDKNK